MTSSEQKIHFSKTLISVLSLREMRDYIFSYLITDFDSGDTVVSEGIYLLSCTCKSLRMELQKYVYLNLKKGYSLRYILDVKFRERINQIGLKISMKIDMNFNIIFCPYLKYENTSKVLIPISKLNFEVYTNTLHYI